MPAFVPTPNLPIELWHTITTYLTTEQVWALRGVCSALFQIALDRRYLCVGVDLECIEREGYAEEIRRYSNPAIATRVRELWLTNNSGSGETHRKWTDDALALLKHAKSPNRKSGTTTSSIRSTISALPNVHALRFMGPTANGSMPVENVSSLNAHALPLFRHALECYKERLERLELHVLPLQLTLSLLTASVTENLLLPGLKKLTVRLPSYPSKLDRSFHQHTELHSSIVSFVSAHSRTLEEVVVQPFGDDTFTYLQLAEISRLHTSFSFIPHLHSIQLDLYLASDLKAYRSFLSLHSGTLRKVEVEIGIYLSRSFEQLKTGLSTIYTPLPHLRSLTLMSGDWKIPQHHPDYDTRATSSPLKGLVPRFRDTLRRLDLGQAKLSEGDWFVIAIECTWPEMRWLRCSLLHAGIETFEELVKSFPRLEEVEMVVGRLKGRKERGEVANGADYIHFSQTLSQTPFTHPLYTLSLNIPSAPRHCVRAVVDAFPSLRTVNDTSKLDFLASCNQWEVLPAVADLG